ncbi:hypothetical protein K523DRAFT_323062 [Schizophyllum commune Tattone D]|nr:hypothetical protein K523DRAFT_323062 [Schizophyllum commune Tattone D]
MPPPPIILFVLATPLYPHIYEPTPSTTDATRTPSRTAGGGVGTSRRRSFCSFGRGGEAP